MSEQANERVHEYREVPAESNPLGLGDGGGSVGGLNFELQVSRSAQLLGKRLGHNPGWRIYSIVWVPIIQTKLAVSLFLSLSLWVNS